MKTRHTVQLLATAGFMLLAFGGAAITLKAQEARHAPPGQAGQVQAGAATKGADVAGHQHRAEATFQIPAPLKKEHEELHAELVKATQAGGKIGEAAKTVANALHPHFVKEEEYALPPLGLLAAVAKGDNHPADASVLTMTDKLKAELPTMLAEHKGIVTALENLKSAARAEGNQDVIHFAEKLTLHAQTEEEVLYPAAILVGEHLKMKLDR